MDNKIVYIIVSAVTCALFSLTPGPAFGYDSKGTRDPFVPLVGQEKGNRPNALQDITLVEDITLEGIAIGPMGKDIAILNGQIVKENDKFGFIQIRSISKNSIEISIEGKVHTLSLQKEKGI